MKPIHKASIRRTSFRRVNAIKLRIIIFIGVIGLIGFIAPFIHIFYNKTGIEGVFNFPLMSQFFFAIGFPILALSAGILQIFITSFIGGFLRTCFRLIAFGFLFVAGYFLIWALLPGISDFSKSVYYVTMISLSFLFSCILYFISKITFQSLTRSEKLIELIGDLKVDHFYPLAAKAQESGIKNVDADVEAFNERVENTLKEIVKN